MENKENAKIENRQMMIAMFFDTDKIDDCFYGNTVFARFIEGNEISKNAFKTVFSVGDILVKSIYDDLNPFLLRDDFCTVSKDEIYNGDIFVFLIEDIELQIAQKIDKRMKSDFCAYIGMSTIDIQSTDKRKQFWKDLVRDFSMEGNIITVFGLEEEGSFGYTETALNKGYIIKYDGLSSDSDCNKFGDLCSTRQSSFIRTEKQLQFSNGKNDSDRGLLEMNFSLVKEVELAGVQIWKSIEDMNRVYLSKDSDVITDYIFTSLYQAAQGIERLLKIVLELTKYKDDDNTENAKIDKLLYSHNHNAMYDYLSKIYTIKLNKNCKKLLNVLSLFYSEARYNRYKYSDCDILELKLLRGFGSEIQKDNFNEDIKNLYGRSLGKISQTLYKLIHKLSNELNIYTYEINYDSEANFALSSYYGENLYETLKQLEQSKKELIWYIIKRGESLQFSKCLSDIEPLDFDICDIAEFISEFITGENSCKSLYDFVSYSYDELISKNKKEWLERVDSINNIIGNTNLVFDEETL